MQSQNLFHEGIRAGIDPSRQPPHSLELLENMRMLAGDGKNRVLTALEGTVPVGQLPENFYVVAQQEYGAVSFLVLAEKREGVWTGKGELGYFLDGYKPLMNYAGDEDTYPLMNGPFRSLFFNFKLQYPVTMVLQEIYDGSVNLIFASGNNPVRIVNCGFKVNGRTLTPIEREDNRYRKENWEDTLNLYLESSSVARLHFRGTLPGGKLKAGTNFYYFRYLTEEGEETDVIAESQAVPVFHGERGVNLRGDAGEGEDTNKQVEFLLTGLDPEYSRLAVYFLYVTGQDEPLFQAQRIRTGYTYSGTTFTFVHTGYEPLEDVDRESLNLSLPHLGSAGCITQIQSRLALADISEKNYNNANFKAYAAATGVLAAEKKLDIFGLDGLERSISEPLNQGSQKPGTDGWNGGYANPMNVYHRTGYFDGEAYPYGMRFILPGNQLSPVFPVTGFDDWGGNAASLYNKNMPRRGVLDEAEGGWFEVEIGGLSMNNKGVYRFPNRFYKAKDLSSGSTGHIQGIRFRLPTDNALFAKIKEQAIGVVFVRGARKPDLLAQGMLFDTALVPIQDEAPSNTDGWKLWNYNSGAGGYNESNSRLIPAFNHFFESRKRYDDDNDSSGNRSNNGIAGLVNCKLNTNQRTLFYGKKFSLISQDFFAAKHRFIGSLGSRDLSMHLLQDLSFRAEVRTPGVDSPNLATVFRQEASKGRIVTPHPVKGSWVEGGISARNEEGFSGRVLFQAKVGGHYGYFPLHYNDYFGISLQQGSLFISAPSTANEAGEIMQEVWNKSYPCGKLVGLYLGQGPRNFSALKTLYSSIDTEQYYPISPRLSWEELAKEVDTNGDITLYGGDCFLNMAFRRLYIRDEDVIDTIDEPTHMGPTVCFLQQSPYNMNYRAEEEFNLASDTKASFAPYGMRLDGGRDIYANGNTWREKRVRESAVQNQGYWVRLGEGRGFALPDVPYVEKRWPGKVVLSPVHNRGSFTNNYRYWAGISEQDYGHQDGRIVAMVELGNGLLLAREHGIERIGVNERVETGGDAAGSVFLEVSQALSPTAYPVRRQLGIQHPQQLLATPTGIYGYDSSRKTPFVVLEGIARELGNESLLPILQRDESWGAACAIYREPDQKEVWFCFPGTNRTYAWNERLQDYGGRWGFAVQAAIPQENGLVVGWDQRLDQFSKTALPSHILGQELKPYLRMSWNDQLLFQKIWKRILLFGDPVLPEEISLEVDGAESLLTPKAEGKLWERNASYAHGRLRIVLPKVQAQNTKQAGLLGRQGTVASFMQPKARLRGTYLSIGIRYPAGKELRLFAASIDDSISETI